MSQPAVQRARFTYGDYRRWPDDERWELIAGAVYDMSRAPTRVHQATVDRLAVGTPRERWGTLGGRLDTGAACLILRPQATT